MTWFKVDDTFFCHPKVIGLDMAARGLWVTAGSWCAQQLTDGVIDEKQIRTIGGTRKQAEKLVAAGLWRVEDVPADAPRTLRERSANARRYAFNDWRDFQPTRDDVLAKRQEARDRMAAARAKRSKTSGNGEMFARTDDERSANVRSSGLRERSPYPDPTRPDPTNKEGVVVKGEVVGGDVFPSPELVDAALDELVAATPATPTPAPTSGQTPDAWSTADAPRCRQHADIPAGDDVPPCRACGSVRQWWQDREAHERDDRRQVILDCSMCDDRGMVDATDTAGRPVAVVCNHTSPPPTPTAPPTNHRPVSSAETRAAALRAATRKKGPF